MTKVFPSEVPCEPSTSMSSPKEATHNLLGVLMQKVHDFVSRAFERRQSSFSSDLPIDVVVTNGHVRSDSAGQLQIPAQVYQQSSTRRLAFEEPTSMDESKPINDFYNNSTLTNISKLFCAIVLIIAFVLVMSRSFNTFDDDRRNTTTEHHQQHSLFF